MPNDMTPKRRTAFKDIKPGQPLNTARLDTEFDQIYNALKAINAFLHTQHEPDGLLRLKSLSPKHFKDGAFNYLTQDINQTLKNGREILDSETKAAQNLLIDARATKAATQQVYEHTKTVLSETNSVLLDAKSAATDASRSRGLTSQMLQQVGIRAQDAETSASSARISEDMAYRWAEKIDGPVFVPMGGNEVDDGFYSSKYWALRADHIIKNGSYFYLGPHPEPPTEGNLGAPLEEGMWYYDTTDQTSYYWNGTDWVAIQEQDPVVSVFGRQGAILAEQADYAAFYALTDHTHTLDQITDFDPGDWVSRTETADQAIVSSFHAKGRISTNTGSATPGSGLDMWSTGSGSWLNNDTGGDFILQSQGSDSLRMSSSLISLYGNVNVAATLPILSLYSDAGQDSLVRMRVDNIIRADLRWDDSADYFYIGVRDSNAVSRRDYRFDYGGVETSLISVLRKADADDLYAQITHDHTEDQITDLDRLRWRNTWVEGTTYEKNDMVVDWPWLAVANVQTDDRPAPQDAGEPFFVYTGAGPTGPITAKTLLVGNTYTLPEALIVPAVRVYTVTGNYYSVFVKDVATGQVDTLLSFTATLTGWVEIPGPGNVLAAGTVFEVGLYVQEPDPSPTIYTLSYNYQTPNNAAVPAVGTISHATKTLSSLRVNKTDQNGDQSANLAQIEVGDTIEGAGVRWSISAITDNGTWIDFSVAPQQLGSPTGIQDFVFETVTATPITVIADPSYYLGNANVSPFYSIDGGPRVASDDAFNVDIQIQPVTISDDWDVASTAGSTASGGDNSGGGVTTFSALSDTPVSYSGQAGKSLVVNGAESGLEYIDNSGEFLPLTGGTLTGDLTMAVEQSDRRDFTVRASDGQVGCEFLAIQSQLQSQFVLDGNNSLANPSITFYGNTSETKWVNITPVFGAGDDDWLRFRVGYTSNATAAEIRPPGTDAATDTTIMTREKADARYLQGGSDPVIEQSLTVRQTSATEWPQIAIDKINDGDAARLYGKFNDVNRWAMDLGAAGSEVGGNLGSDFSMNRYADDGSILGTPFIIRRDTGNVEMANGFTVPNNEFHDPTGVASWRILGTTLECWGKYPQPGEGNGVATVTFPKTFMRAPVVNTTPAEGGSGPEIYGAPPHTISVTGFVAQRSYVVRDGSGGGPATQGFEWRAIGEWDQIS